MSEDEAQKQAVGQFFVKNPLASFAGGVLSGGVMGGGATAVNIADSKIKSAITELPSKGNIFPDRTDMTTAQAQPQNIDLPAAEDINISTSDETKYNYQKSIKEQPVRLPKEQTVETFKSGQELGIDNKVLSKVMDISEKFNVKVEFEDSGNINGRYKNGVVYLNKNSKNPVIDIFKHELTHHLETSEDYIPFQAFIENNNAKFNVMKDAEGKPILWDDFTQDIKERYARRGINLNEQELNHEITANFVEKFMFTKDKAIERLAQQDITLAQRIKQWISDMIVKVKGTPEEKFLLEAEKKYLNALQKVEKTQSPVKNISQDAQFSITTDTDGNKYVKIDTDQHLFESVPVKDYPQIARNIILEKFRNKVIGTEENKAYVKKRTAEEYAYPAARRMETDLSVNPRVAFQQPTSYLMASAYLHWDSLMKGLNPSKKVSKELISKYSSTYWYRAQGNSTQELADITRYQPEWQKKVPVLMNWIQSADEWTLRRLWVASEAEVSKINPELKKGSDAFYKEVANKYDEAIYNSQSNNMTLQKAGYLRTTNKLYQAINMFQNQRSQNFNMIYESWSELQEAKKSYNSDKSKDNAKKFQESGTRFTNTVAGLVGSAALIAGTNLLVAALSSNMRDYEDEEKKEVTAKSLMKGYTKDVLATNLGNFPYLDIVFNAAESVITGKDFDPARYGGIQAPNINMINNLLRNSVNFGKAIKEVGGISGDLFENGELKAIVPKAYESLAKPFKDMALTLSELTGIPLKNAEKYVIGLADTALKVTGQDISLKTSYEELFKKKTVSDLKYANKDRLNTTFHHVTDNNVKLGISVKDELFRLYQPERNTAVVPKEPPTYFEVNGQTKQLTPSEQEKFKRSYKETVETHLPALIDSAYYKNSSDTDKGKCISDLYSYASALAKSEISEYNIENTWYDKAKNISGVPRRADIVPVETYISYKNRFRDIKENSEKRKLLFDDTNLTAKQKSALDESLINDVTIIPKDITVDYNSRGSFELSQQSASKQEKYTDELAKNISKEKYAQAVDTVRNIEGLKDNNGNAIQNSYSMLLREAIDGMAGFPSAEDIYTLDEKKALYEPLGVAKSVREMPLQKFKFELQKIKWKAKLSG